MATVATILDASKYDLRNYGAKEFDNTQMIHYLNRMIVLLDRALISHNSDQTLTESSITLTSGTDVVPVPTSTTVNIREIWDDDQTLLYRMGARELYERRMHRYGDTAEPKYWAHIQNNIEFEVTADADYSFTVYHDVMSTVLTATTDSMPYNSRYDEYIREAVVMCVRGRKNKKIEQTDAIYLQMFMETVHQDIINRDFIPKVRLDF